MWLMATIRGQCRAKPPTQLEKLVWVLGWGVGILQQREITFMPAPTASMAEANRLGAPRAGKGQCQWVDRSSQARLETTTHPCPSLGWYLLWTLCHAECLRKAL